MISIYLCIILFVLNFGKYEFTSTFGLGIFAIQTEVMLGWMTAQQNIEAIQNQQLEVFLKITIDNLAFFLKKSTSTSQAYKVMLASTARDDNVIRHIIHANYLRFFSEKKKNKTICFPHGYKKTKTLNKI